MAKKARRRLEEDAAPPFEFPEFDEASFVRHEYEQTNAMFFSIVVAVGLAVLSLALDRLLAGVSPASLQGWVPAAVSLALIAISPLILLRLRNGAPDYTRGDWATVILLEVFGWLGFWFLLSDVFPAH